MTRISRAISNTVSFSPSRAIETSSHMDLSGGGGGGGTSTFTVSAGADDGYVFKATQSQSIPTSGWGSPSNSGSVVIIGGAEDYDNYPNIYSHWLAYFRFQNVTVAQGATIQSAFLKPHQSSSTSRTLSIKGFDKDNVSAPTAGSDLATSNFTTAGISNFSSGTGNALRTSPDIKTIIQEIVDRSGWSSGNAIMVAVFIPTLSGMSTTWNARTFEHSSASQACQLEITT